MRLADRIPPWPRIDPPDETALLDVLRSRRWWRGNGTQGDAFEAAFADFLGVAHVRAVANGTLALELALEALGVGPGDEVIVPACTFISTASAVLRIGAWPIPVDVEPHTLNLDVTAFEAAVTPRTRCVIPVHMAGQAVRMPEISAIAARHGFPVLEDAAHAHGARAFGASLGSLGDAAIFSFQSGKLMTCGEGGAVATGRPDIADKTFAMHSCGRPQGDTDYAHLMPATNMRLTEFQSALLAGQLRRLPEQVARRERAAPFFEARLREEPAGDAGIWRTGDVVRIEPDGTAMLLGRLADRLKINGYTIDGADLARLARGISGVSDAVALAVPRPDRPDTADLVLVCETEESRREVVAASFTAHACGLPIRIEAVEKLPRTAAAKIDRAALLRSIVARRRDGSVPDAPPEHLRETGAALEPAG